MDYLQEIHRLIVQNEREIRALKARLARFSSGGTLLSGALTPHGLLAAEHPDTVPGGPEEGFIIIGNGTSQWEKRVLFDDSGIVDPGVSLFPARNDHGHTDTGGTGTNTLVFDASGLTDGAEDQFFTPEFFIEDSTRVHLNGLLVRPVFDYTEDALFDAITMVVPPAAGDELVIEYVPEAS